MNRPITHNITGSLLVLLFASTALVANAQIEHKSISPEQLEFFEKNIRPVLVAHCYECHSEEKGMSKSELTLDTRDGIRAGGTRGPAVVPGKPDDSVLIQAIRQTGQLHMPPDSRGGMLPDDVIANFEKWVKDGAADPRDSAKIVAVQKAKPEKPIDWDKARQFWAFQQPKVVEPPKVVDGQWPRTDVDHFVLAKLEEKGLKPVADADKRTLLRRAYYDIIGLPPTPAEVDAFVKDKSPDAFAKVVNQLLDSPRFGEQWGRYWLDIARYGESTGLDRNLNYPYAWRYRNYVIDAFNHDKPYDRFIQEQLAGDQLPYKDQKERDENLTATGFLAIGPKGLNEGRVKYSKWQVVGDQIDVTSRGFLGLTVGCAQCHDHKFDPIPQKDYHALAGIFASTETLYGTVGGRGNRRPTSLLSLDGAPELAVLSTGEPTPNMFVNTNRNYAIGDSTNQLARTRRLGNGNGNGFGGGFGGRRFGRNISTNQLERIPAHNAYAMGVRDYDEPQDSPVYYRGDLTKPMDTVPRGFLRILSLTNAPAIPANESGRLQLAQWITDPENPLTARVAVNRVWQHLFGAGIVATPDNLGHLGGRPSNQELLDYLAVKFVNDDHWSVKQLIRSLVLTRAYQLSSDIDPKAEEVDPENTFVWRASPRRLTAEQLRDSILTASGRLDLEPPQYSVTAEFGDGYYGVNIWESDLPQHYYKRSVYLPVPRDMVPDVLAVFDLPNPNLVGALREDTTSPSQELFLLNNALVEDEALHLARNLEQNKKLSEKGRIRQAYLTIFQREPTSGEIKQARKFIKAEKALLASETPAKAEKRYSSPELDAQATAQLTAATPPTAVRSATTLVPVLTQVSMNLTPPAAAVSANAPPSVVTPGGNAGNGGYRGGYRQRRYLGPGSASDVVVGKLAPGIARPPVFHQVLPEKPATPEEGSLALFNQALFGSAEFRYLQ
ncbi:MAG: PSD1 and planctomycete cytochrome C domain-containing protein [Verrucomicrobiota bacterium]